MGKMTKTKIENCFFVKSWESAKCGLIPIDRVKPKNITVDDYAQMYCSITKTTAKKEKIGVVTPDKGFCKVEMYCLTSNDALELPVFEKDNLELPAFKDAGVNAVKFKGRYITPDKKTLII